MCNAGCFQILAPRSVPIVIYYYHHPFSCFAFEPTPQLQMGPYSVIALMAAYVPNIELLSISFLFRAWSSSFYLLILKYQHSRTPSPSCTASSSTMIAPTATQYSQPSEALSMLACTLPTNTVERFFQLRSASRTPDSSVLELLIP
jgi:hypothetical protein